MRSMVQARRGRSGFGTGAGAIEALEGRRLMSVSTIANLPDVRLSAGVAAGKQTVDLSDYFSDPSVSPDTVFVNTSLGVIPVELTPGATPLTVANFLNYVESGRYSNSFFHRSVHNFVIQGGGFVVSGESLAPVTTDAPVRDEYSDTRLNTRGTIAMAKSGPDTATSQFFFNLKDNSGSLNDTGNSGGFTVFGTVASDEGLSVMDSIAAVQVVDASGGNPNSPFGELPVKDFVQDQGDIRLNQLVYINSVTEGASYAVTSDNPSVLTVGVQGKDLVYTPVANGTAHVTVVARSGDGLPVARTFAVTVGEPTPSNGGDPSGDGGGGAVTDPTAAKSVVLTKGKSLAYRDRDGTFATVSVSGPGAVTVRFGGDGVATRVKAGVTIVSGTGLVVQGIDVAGGTGKTAITVATRGGNKQVDIGGINSEGTVGAFDGTGVNFSGTSDVSGAIKSFNIRSLGTDAVMTLGTVGTLDVDGILGGSITAQRLGTVSAATIRGARVVVAGGGMSLGNLSAKSVKDSNILVAGNVGTVNVTGSMTGSRLLAGVTGATPTVGDAAAGSGRISSIRVGGGPRGNVLAHSAVAAKVIKSAVFGNLADVASTADFYGVEANVIQGMNGFVGGKPFAFKNARTQAQVEQQLKKARITLKNLKIVAV